MVEQQVNSRRTPKHEFPASGLDDEFVVGADIGGTNLRLALADMAGTIRARWSASTVGIRSAARVVELISEGTDTLLQQTATSRSALKAAAAGAPGITDVDRGVVIATSYLMGWRDVPLLTLLETALGIPASIDNDVNLAALGEHHAGSARDIDNFVFIAIGTGVGAGIVANGELMRGAAWTAGEIGYMLVPGASETPVKRGQPGALESIVGGEGIKAYWQEHWMENSTTLPQISSATEIFDGALKGDTLACQVLQRAARTLSYAIYNLSLTLNCPLFVLGGSIGLHQAFIEATQTFLQARSARVQLNLVRSTLGSEAQLTGAISLAIHTATASKPVAQP